MKNLLNNNNNKYSSFNTGFDPYLRLAIKRMLALQPSPSLTFARYKSDYSHKAPLAVNENKFNKFIKGPYLF